MPEGGNPALKRLLVGLAAFFGPILLGALVIQVGGFWAFWLLCYVLMVSLPVLIVFYLVYKYFIQIAAEKVENRLAAEGEEFLNQLKSRFEVIEDALWDRSLRGRSKLSPRRPFDRLALWVTENWQRADHQNKQQLAEKIAHTLQNWREEKGWGKKSAVRLDFYQDAGGCAEQVGRFESDKYIPARGKG